MLQSLWSLVSPPFCMSCRIGLPQREPLCIKCAREHLIPCVSKTLTINSCYVMPVHAASLYEGIIQRLIRAKHFNNRLAARQLGVCVARHAGLDWAAYDVVIPVPLHWKRWYKRGFNQAEVMAQQIASLHDLVVDTHLKRYRRSEYQASLTRVERQHNVANCFMYNKALNTLKDRRILLVDDVMTTGATLTAAAKVLAQGMPSAITAVVAARGR